MKSWLSNWKRRRETNVAAELRASRPEPSARFVKTLAARINPRAAQPARTRTRLGLAAAVTATMVAVVGATGGFSAAASTIAGATHSVAQITHVSSTPSALVRNAVSASKPIRPRSADGQYAESPTVTGFDPDHGAPGTTVTVTGTNFAGASAVTSVTLHGTPAAFDVTSNSTLTFTVPAGATSGVIEVSNAAGSADSTSFTVIQTPQFDDTAFSPTHGGAGTPVALYGSHFTGVTKVMIGGKSAPIYDSSSDTEIDTAVPVGAATGPGSITVTNPAGSASASGFTVDSGAPGNITFSPGSGVVGQSITITGKNLDVAGTPSDVMFTGAADPASLTDGTTQTNTTLHVDVPADAATGTITVSNDAGSFTTSKSFVVLGTPHISSVSPSFGVKNTPIVIKGDTFKGAKNVIFEPGDVTVSTGLAISGDSQITVNAPSGLTKGTTYTLKVTGKTGDVSDASSDTFYFEAKPVIGALAPPSGAAGKQIAITPNASSTFLGAKKVTFGGVQATIVNNTPGEIDALVPKGLVTGTAESNDVPVVVANAAGSSTGVTFTVLNTAPTVKTIEPATAAEAGDRITITGKNLNNANTTVTFDGGSSCTVPNGDLTKSTSTGTKPVDTISFIVPDCARTGSLTIDNVDGSVSVKSYTIYLQPVVEGFKPAYGVSGSKISVIGAPGTFVGAYEVDFGSAVAKSGIVVAPDGGSLKVIVPKDASKDPLAAGSYQVTVKVNKADGDLSGNSGNTGFTIVAKPANLTFTDPGGIAGHSFTLSGDNLLGITAVKFGQVSAVFQQVASGGVVDSHHLTVFVPAGATSHAVTVFNAAAPTGVSTAAKYPILVIKNVSPASTKHGKAATITVTGSGFDFDSAFAAVTIGGESVTPKSGSNDKSLLLRLPLDLPAGDQTIDISNSLGDVTATLTLK